MIAYGHMGAPGASSIAWFVRWGVQGAADLAIAGVCVVLLTKLRLLAAGRNQHKTIARLCLTLGVLVAVMMVLVVALGVIN